MTSALRIVGLTCCLYLALCHHSRAAFVAKPSWTMSQTFVVTNTGNVNIGSITWTPGFRCPRTSLGAKSNKSMQCVKDAATKSVVVKGVPTSGRVLDLMWSEVPPTQPPLVCYLLGTGSTYLTTGTGERLTCQ